MRLGLGLGLSTRRPTFTPASLFASGTSGGWYTNHPEYLATNTDGTGAVSDGSAVAYRQDRSGNGRHQTQATAAERPIYRTDGTLHWLEYDGTDDALIADPYVADVPSVLGMALSTTDADAILRGEAGDTGTYLYAAKDADTSTAIYATRGTAPTSFRANGAAQSPADRDAAQTILTGNQVFLWEGHTWGLAAVGGNSMWLGYAATSFRYTGRDYGGVEIFDKTLNATERGNLEEYLAGLAGVTL